MAQGDEGDDERPNDDLASRQSGRLSDMGWEDDSSLFDYFWPRLGLELVLFLLSSVNNGGPGHP